MDHLAHMDERTRAWLAADQAERLERIECALAQARDEGVGALAEPFIVVQPWPWCLVAVGVKSGIVGIGHDADEAQTDFMRSHTGRFDGVPAKTRDGACGLQILLAGALQCTKVAP